jgi:hypothetical protein
MMEAVSSSEMSINIYRTTQSNIFSKKRSFNEGQSVIHNIQIPVIQDRGCVIVQTMMDACILSTVNNEPGKSLYVY